MEQNPINDDDEHHESTVLPEVRVGASKVAWTLTFKAEMASNRLADQFALRFLGKLRPILGAHSCAMRFCHVKARSPELCPKIVFSARVQNVKLLWKNKQRQ